MEVMLTGEQITALDRCIQEFQAANYQVQEKIVNHFIRSFQGNLSDNNFDALGTQTVYVPFSTLGCSQMFPGYLLVPLCKNQTGGKKICSSNQQSDGQRKVHMLQSTQIFTPLHSTTTITYSPTNHHCRPTTTISTTHA